MLSFLLDSSCDAKNFSDSRKPPPDKLGAMTNKLIIP